MDQLRGSFLTISGIATRRTNGDSSKEEATGQFLALKLECRKCGKVWQAHETAHNSPALPPSDMHAPALHPVAVRELETSRNVTHGSTYKCPAIGCDHSEVITKDNIVLAIARDL